MAESPFSADDQMLYLTEEYGPDMQYLFLTMTLNKHFNIEITEFYETLANFLNLISQKITSVHNTISADDQISHQV